MEILTKKQAAEIAIMPSRSVWGDIISDKVVNKTINYPNYKFIRVFRRSTGLKLCSFAPDRFYIRYDN